MTFTNVNVSVICSNVNCKHFVLASVLVHNQLAETEGANTTSFRFWRPISSRWVQAVLEVLCQPAAVAALCNIGVGTVSNPLLHFSSSMCHLGPAVQTRPPASPAARWAPGAGIPSPRAPTSSRTSATTVYSRPSARETLPRSSWLATS